jgi:7-cyano-7-deazaguanine synthase in queuosine biosynthesis
MPFTCLLLSGGLDSVALGILLARRGHELEPVYVSHRHGGNVTRKEVDVAAEMARDVCGRGLVVVKAPTQDESWWEESSDQLLHVSRKLLPIPKERKARRNRIFLKVLKQAGIVDQVDHVAIGVFPVGPNDGYSRSEAKDYDHEALEDSAGLDPGVLITLAAMGINTKTEMLKAVGRRSQKDQQLLYASESCLMYFNTHCGDCESCKGRARAFMEAWGEDRTTYRRDTFAWRHKRGIE